MRRKTSSATSTRLTGRKFETCTTSASQSSGGHEPRAQRRVGPAAIDAAVEKVGDDGDRVTHAERGDGVGAQALGHRGHGVRLLDREGHDAAYDGSLPTSVMSVPCSVVTVRGAVAASSEASI